MGEGDLTVGSIPSSQEEVPSTAPRFTHRQGQYLAYIHFYTKVHRIPPSENEIARYFGVAGPSAHRMILALEAKDLLWRTPGSPRTLRVRLDREEVPDLD